MKTFKEHFKKYVVEYSTSVLFLIVFGFIAFKAMTMEPPKPYIRGGIIESRPAPVLVVDSCIQNKLVVKDTIIIVKDTTKLTPKKKKHKHSRTKFVK